MTGSHENAIKIARDVLLTNGKTLDDAIHAYIASLPSSNIIATAIMNERERCAVLVENFTYADESNELLKAVNANLRRAAREIRGVKSRANGGKKRCDDELVKRLKEGTTGSEGITKTDRYINSIMHEAAIVIETQASELVAIKEGSSGVFAANMSPMRSYWLQAENEQLRLDLSSERAAHERAKQLLSEEEAFRVRAISNMEAAEFDRDEYHHHAAANGRLAWELLEKLQAAEARITELEKALNEASDALDAAMEDVEHWGGYAGEYFQDKHDLDGDLARISEQATSARRALGGKNV